MFFGMLPRVLLHLLQQRDLAGVIELVLHYAVEHVVKGVVGALFAGDLVEEGLLREFLDGGDEFHVNLMEVFEGFCPRGVAGIRDGRKFFLAESSFTGTPVMRRRATPSQAAMWSTSSQMECAFFTG